MRMHTHSRARRALFLPLLVISASCQEQENTLQPSQITYSDLPDIFSFSVTGMDNVTDHEFFLWTMTGDQATVDVISGLTEGSAFLQMRGGNGQIVFADDLRAGVDTVTDVNFPGLWQIDIVFEKADGDISIAIERDTIP
jgi:hypothetical protein